MSTRRWASCIRSGARCPGRFKDYVALPKPNNYQSLHTTVIGPYGERMEVQIRTEEMHRDAELGIAAHWKYKEGELRGHDTDDEKFAWLRQLLEWHQDLADPHEFLETVKVDLFPDEVFVFTPKGEVINLAARLDAGRLRVRDSQRGRCALRRSQGERQDGPPSFPALGRRHRRDPHEQASQHPRKDWLEFVATGKARSRIRNARSARPDRARSVELGRDILERELRKAGFSLKELLASDALGKMGRRGRSAARSKISSRR